MAATIDNISVPFACASAGQEIEVRLRPVEKGVSRLPAFTLPALRRVFSPAETETRSYGQVVFSMEPGMPTMRIRFDDSSVDGNGVSKVSTEEGGLTAYFRDGARWYGGDMVPVLDRIWDSDARQIKWQYFVKDFDDAPLRLSMAMEKGMNDCHEIADQASRLMDPCTAQKIRNVLSYFRRLKSSDIPQACSSGKLQATFRYIKRHTTRNPDPMHKVDISLTRRVDSYLPHVQTPKTPGLAGGGTTPVVPPYEYEIEFELDGPYNTPDVEDRIQALVGKAAYLASELLWGNPATDMAIDDHPFASLDDTRAALSTFTDLRQLTGKREVPKAVPTQNILSLCGATFYTNKADGVTAYLVTSWSSDGRSLVPYVITRDAAAESGFLARALPSWSYRAIPASSKRGQSLLMGELVNLSRGASAGEPRFLAFDALVVNGKSVVPEELRQRLDKMGAVVRSLGKDIQPKMAFVQSKPVKEIPREIPEYLSDDEEYDKDGLILMGHGPIYAGPHRTRPVVYKWKKDKDQTVDLLVHYSREEGKFVLLCGHTFFVEDNRGVTVSVYTFAYPSVVGIDMSRIDFSCLADDTIVEFRFDLESSSITPHESKSCKAGCSKIRGMVPQLEWSRQDYPRLCPVRIRADKTARYHRALRQMNHVMQREGVRMRAMRTHITNKIRQATRGVKSMRPEWVGLLQSRRWSFPEPGANNTKVFDQTNLLAHKPLTLDTINRDSALWRSSYFGKRQSKPPSLKNMVFLNSQIKEALMRRLLRDVPGKGNGVKVLDLGCGEGNDLPRWSKFSRSIRSYLGIDRDTCAVAEARRRLRLPKYRSFASKADYKMGRFALKPDTESAPFADDSMYNLLLEEDTHLGERSKEVIDYTSDVDVVTCFYAIHYAKSQADPYALRTLLKRVNRRMGPSSRFGVSFMDADRVMKEMHGRGEVVHKGHYRVGMTPLLATPEAGATKATVSGEDDMWYVYLRGIGKETPEPRLGYDELVSEAMRAGLVVDTELSIQEALGLSTRRDLESYWERKGVCPPEQRLMSFYRYVVFRSGADVPLSPVLPPIEDSKIGMTSPLLDTGSPPVSPEYDPTTPPYEPTTPPYEPTTPPYVPTTPPYEPTTPPYEPTTPPYVPTTPPYVPTTPPYDPTTPPYDPTTPPEDLRGDDTEMLDDMFK